MGTLNKLLTVSMMLALAFVLVIPAILSAPLSSVEYKYTGTPYVASDENIDVTYVSAEPDPVEPGKYVTLRFKAENRANQETPDLYFKIQYDYPFSMDRQDAAVVHVGAMLPNQYGDNAAIIKYTLRVDRNAVEGTSYVDVGMFYGSDMSRMQLKKDFPVSIKTYESILDVQSIVTSPEMVAPGSKGKVTISLKNQADSYIDNVKVSLGYVELTTTAYAIDYRELPLSPFSDSSEKTVQHIPAGGTASLDFNFIADTQADSKVYKLPITITYYDSNAVNYTKRAIIGVLVGDKPDLAERLAYSDAATAGSEGEVSIEFINKGLIDVKRAYATLVDNPSAYTVIGANNVYMGNIDKDDTVPATYKIRVSNSAKDRINLRVQLEYRDGNNRLYNEQIDVPMAISPKTISLDPAWITVLIILILAIAGVFVVLSNKKGR